MLRYPIEIAIDVAVVGEKGEEVGLTKLHWRRWQTLGKYRSFTVCTNQGPKENNFQLTQVGESKMLRPKPCQTLLTFSIRSYCHADVVVLLQYRRTFG